MSVNAGNSLKVTTTKKGNAACDTYAHGKCKKERFFLTPKRSGLGLKGLRTRKR